MQRRGCSMERRRRGMGGIESKSLELFNRMMENDE
jgi:hypothetical protein